MAFFNFAAFLILRKKGGHEFVTILDSRQNLQSSDICGVWMFVAKLAA